MVQTKAEYVTGQDATTSRLRQAIARLCTDFSDLQADRRDADAGHVNLMQALLVQIDETMLPRRLTLFFGQDAVAKLRVCNRRLLSLELTNGPGPEGPARLTSAAQVYAQQLQQLSATYQGTGFRITRQVCETGIETQSCSATQLAECLTLQPQQGSRLTHVLAGISAMADAWVLQGEDASEDSRFGPAALTEQLTELAHTDRTTKNNNGHALRMPEITPSYLVLSISSDTKVIIAWDQAETLLVAVPAQHLPEMGAAWHKVFSSL